MAPAPLTVSKPESITTSPGGDRYVPDSDVNTSDRTVVAGSIDDDTVDVDRIAAGKEAVAQPFDTTSTRQGNAYGLSSTAAKNFYEYHKNLAVELRRQADEADATADAYLDDLSDEDRKLVLGDSEVDDDSVVPDNTDAVDTLPVDGTTTTVVDGTVNDDTVVDGTVDQPSTIGSMTVDSNTTVDSPTVDSPTPITPTPEG